VEEYVEETDERGGIVVRELTIERDNTHRPVTAALWTPAGSTGERPLVCFGHGASGDRYQQPIPWLVQRLVGEHGFAGLSLDGPVHGRRQTGKGGRDAFWPEWRREGTVEEMTADWQATLDIVQGFDDVGAAGPIGYWGLSMGTIYGAPFVATESRITAAVLGLMGITGPDHYRPVIATAASAIDIPVLFIMQLEDELFTRRECLALFDALATNDKRLHANAGLHPDVPMEELHNSVAFLAERLSGATADREVAFDVAT
jgi:dienelactone hydrolase